MRSWRWRAGGIATLLMGAALIVPVVVHRLESGRLNGPGIGFIAAGCCLVAAGATAAMRGQRQGGAAMPSGPRAAVTANVLILAFLALELSDRAVRQEGKLLYWTTFLLPPTLLLLGGLLAARPWSWRVARGATIVGVLWFMGFLAMVPFAPLQTDGVPAPWYGRIYVAALTLAFAGVFAGAFRALGRPETRRFFGVARMGAGEPVTVANQPARRPDGAEPGT